MTAYAHVPNGSYTPGRARPVRLIVLHTTESPADTGRAVAVAQFLARPATRASAHWVVDAGTIVSQVDEGDTAWAAPGANADGIQVEQCSYAGWGPADWADPTAQAMLRNTAQLLADIHTRTGIPLVHLSNAELAAGRSGVIGHVQASEVYRQSDHWDPGPSYPYDLVLGWAVELAGSSGAASTDHTPRQESDLEMMTTALSDPKQGGNGTLYVLDALGQCWALRDDTTRQVLQALGKLSKDPAALVHPNTFAVLHYCGVWEDNEQPLAAPGKPA